MLFAHFNLAFACRLPWLWESKENRFVKIQDRLVNYGKVCVHDALISNSLMFFVFIGLVWIITECGANGFLQHGSCTGH